jgi:U3 small nucleolar ribonucleoprotein protein IMP4
MRFTTSRRPSPGARRLARTLARFFGSEYMTRGKSGLDEDVGEVWMVVVEEHGNPAGLARRSQGEEKVLRFAAAIEGESKRMKSRRPSVVGTGKLPSDVAEFFNLDISPVAEDERAIKVTGHQIDFVDGENLIVRLKI